MKTTKATRISWTSLRGRQERKGTRASGGRGRGKVFYPGNVVDGCVRRWLAAPDGDLVDVLPEQIEASEADLKSQGTKLRWEARERDLMLDSCERALIALQPMLERLVLPYEYESGYRFETPEIATDEDSFYLVGELDLLVKTDDGYRIHDVKMTSNEGYWRHTLGQLPFYAVALDFLGMPVQSASLLQPLCTPRELRADLSQTALNSVLRAISDYLR